MIWQKIQTSLLMARLGSELFDDIVPTLLDENLSEDDPLADFALARSILLSGKRRGARRSGGTRTQKTTARTGRDVYIAKD